MSDTRSVLSLDTSRIASNRRDDDDVGSVLHLDKTESDSESEVASQSGGESEAESEYEEYDLTNNPLYQVLSAFLEDDDGNNLCDHIQKLTSAVKDNSAKLDQLLQKKSVVSSSSSRKKLSKK
tara:strand:- start:232 stop:600 length:369 start_codon:yes stop_codon:yes gene_type:complete